MMAGGFAILGALSYLFIVPEIKPLEAKPRAPQSEVAPAERPPSLLARSAATLT